jgi:hypothetical protein
MGSVKFQDRELASKRDRYGFDAFFASLLMAFANCSVAQTMAGFCGGGLRLSTWVVNSPQFDGSKAQRILPYSSVS